MYFYHSTTKKALKSILKNGFKDGTGYYRTCELFTGVWLSNKPLDENEGTQGHCILRISIPIDKILKYEWIELGKPYREFLVPAKVVNKWTVSVVDDYE